jgi:hypothetical protein
MLDRPVTLLMRNPEVMSGDIVLEIDEGLAPTGSRTAP